MAIYHVYQVDFYHIHDQYEGHSVEEQRTLVFTTNSFSEAFQRTGQLNLEYNDTPLLFEFELVEPSPQPIDINDEIMF